MPSWASIFVAQCRDVSYPWFCSRKGAYCLVAYGGSQALQVPYLRRLHRDPVIVYFSHRCHDAPWYVITRYRASLIPVLNDLQEAYIISEATESALLVSKTLPPYLSSPTICKNILLIWLHVSDNLFSFINVSLTIFFLWPLFSSILNPKVKRVATRTLMCVVVLEDKIWF
jgi:hypothetical protein